MHIGWKKMTRWSLLIILLISVWIIQSSSSLGEAYARNIYPHIAFVLSSFSSLVPFSLGDCFIAIGSVGSLLYLCCIIWKKKTIKRHLPVILEFFVWVYVWFYMAWGLNYFREDFYNRSGIQQQAYTSENFRSFLDDYLLRLNESYVRVGNIDSLPIEPSIRKGYQSIADTFGITSPTRKLHVKNMLASSFMSKMGITGYMGPFFTEFHLNRELLPVEYPFTYAHEAAHRLSIAGEAEANLYAYLVCTRSDVSEIRFSGYFSLLGYVLRNASNLLPEEEFRTGIQGIRPEIIALYKEQQAYWRSKHRKTIGKVQNKVYNSFLKTNRISSGTKNYSEVIGLLISYRESTNAGLKR